MDTQKEYTREGLKFTLTDGTIKIITLEQLREMEIHAKSRETGAKQFTEKIQCDINALINASAE